MRNAFRRIILLIRGVMIFKDWPMWLAYRFDLEGLKPKDKKVFRMRNGVKFHIDAGRTQPGVFQEIWLMDLYQKFYKIKPGDTVIDVGAHIGAFSVLAAKKGARVFAYEPTPRSYEYLVKNSEGYKIKPFNLAVAEKPGEVKMFEAKGGDEGNSLIGEGVSSNTYTAKATTLEEIFKTNNIERCDLLKMDCEGGELDILRSTPPYIWDKVRNVAMEYHKNLPEVLEILKRNGFDNLGTEGKEFGYVWQRKRLFSN